MKNRKKAIALSAIAILMLSSSVYAGKIISDADMSNISVEPDKQFGFGGWNYDNVDVRIVNTSDFSGNVGTFNADGTYTTMGADMSFESDIKDSSGVVVGHLHGKDWPVGEPSGIKVINGDTKTKHGKPENCIMTSSYLSHQDMDDETSGSGYLDAWPTEPNPVLCSSPFQTHKRYKINLLPTTVEGVTPGEYGKPVDLVFNLDSSDLSTGITRYQLLQKANNYTGMRLDGYKVEVLDANGLKNSALTLSLGEGEGLDNDDVADGSNIWNPEDMANMSHGLWGAIDKHFEQPGFFDSIRAYYPVTLSDTNTISYTGDMLGGNYQALFGNWLPSVWEPTGIFHDDDNNPETDGVIKAFLGVAPGFTERAWYKSTVDITDPKHPVYTWSEATDTDFAEWTGDLYEEGAIEDVLNLGLNYIINIGENAAIGSTFILRITPHISTNQTPPSSYSYFEAYDSYTEGLDEFVSTYYKEVLGRNADTHGLNAWTGELKSGQSAGEDVARGVINSDEYTQRKSDDSTYVTMLYKALLVREPDTGGLNYWIGELGNGASRSSVLDSFIYSLEYANVANSYDVDPFNTEITPINTFVRRLYLVVLNRSAEEAGLVDWSNRLYSQESTGADIARGFVFSQEFINRDTNDLTYLTTLYKAFLNRDPDTAGLNEWITALESGTSRYDVLDGFLFSQEFENLSQTYGIIATNP